MKSHTLALVVGAFLAACGGTATTGEGVPNESGGGGSHSTGAISGGGGTSSGGGASGSGGVNTSGGSGGQIPYETWQACGVDADCVAVPENTCCGCVPFGVNAKYADDARAEFAKFDAASCPPLGCATQGCPADPVPVCLNGSCTWKPGCSARSETDCETDGQCEAYFGRACGSATSGFVACSKPKGICDSALTCAAGPFQGQYVFPDGCVPLGWTACDTQCD